jgi:uncharacterized membrane protein
MTHTFQIQVNYSRDGEDHSDTTSYPQGIRAKMNAIAIGSVIGASLGALLKGLTAPSQFETTASVLRVVSASVIASIAVVVAFARKSNAQAIVSVEDFWGGALIGFTVGFFGFEQFYDLFPHKSAPKS